MYTIVSEMEMARFCIIIKYHMFTSLNATVFITVVRKTDVLTIQTQVLLNFERNYAI